MMDSSAWNVTDHTMQSTADEEFQQFLDMNTMGGLGDGINYDFHDFHHSTGTHMLHPPREHLDTPMTGTDASMIMSPVDPGLQRQMPSITTTAPYQTIPTTMIAPHTPTEALVDSIDAQIHFLQRQKLEHQQRQLDEQRAAFFAYQQNHMVPPTPQSLELQAAATQFYVQSNQAEQHEHRQQAVDYRYPRLKDRHDMSFTPLVSPAVTPLETHFPVDTQFTVPGAYFSPLTSPALHAQNDSLAVFDRSLGAVPASSPREMELETAVATAPLPSPVPGDLAKKVRKNAAKARSKSSVKQSPISKPLRRKTATTPTLNAQILSELVENAEENRDCPQPQSNSQGQTSASSTGVTDSENGSVSPQALNDMAPLEMPPPPIPKPRSAKPSPYIAPQNTAVPGHLQAVLSKVPSPATPASLMKLSSPNNQTAGTRTGSHEPMDTDHIETFELPESASFSKPDLPPLDTSASPQIPQQDKALSTPGLLPLPSPTITKLPIPVSATQSPLLTPGSGSTTRKTPLLAARGSKKRASVSSVQVSPALRPKISPNIMPLLPGGASAEDTASHLLATKSNYQRILEGNVVPGVTYPSELSTNLSSKRTSHKIAEQGRRNRINSALQEIATLLPRPPPKDTKEAVEADEGGDSKDKSGAAPNSKASTVELAIEYIKQLQKEVAEANRRAEEAEKKLGLKEGGDVDG